MRSRYNYQNKLKTSYMQCKICDKETEDGKTLNICAVHYFICDLCYKKLYYHFKDIIVDKIKHP